MRTYLIAAAAATTLLVALPADAAAPGRDPHTGEANGFQADLNQLMEGIRSWGFCCGGSSGAQNSVQGQTSNRYWDAPSPSAGASSRNGVQGRARGSFYDDRR